MYIHIPCVYVYIHIHTYTALTNVNPSELLPYSKLKTFKKAGVKTWLCPFPNCKLFKHKEARPSFQRLHVACHSIQKQMLQGEQASDTMQHCALCGSVSKGCCMELRKGSKSTRPLFKCRNGVVFGNWSDKTFLVKKENTPRVVKCRACRQWKWNFNLENHYKEEHPKIQMDGVDAEVCKEIKAKFAKKHIQKHQSAKQPKKNSPEEKISTKEKVRLEEKVSYSELSQKETKDRYEFAGHVDKVSTEETHQEIKRRNEFGRHATTTSKKQKVKKPLPKPKKRGMNLVDMLQQPRKKQKVKEPLPKPKKRRRTISDDSSGSEVESKPPQKRRKLRKKPTPMDDYQFDDELESSSDDNNNVFARQRKKQQLCPPSPPSKREDPLAEWDGLMQD